MASIIERPLVQHRVQTCFIRVPAAAWPAVSSGQISEFRQAAGNAPQLWRMPLPTLVIIYNRRHQPTFDYRLVMLEEIRQEMLGSITAEGLERAGYTGEQAFERYRRDIALSSRQRFSPLTHVFVYRVRPVQDDGDLVAVGATLVNRLYGDVMDAIDMPRTIRVSGTAVKL